MRLSVIIVSYNTKKFTFKCLSSIFHFAKKTNLDFEVIVVDNASVDGSKEMIKEKFPQVTLLENEQNLGFAKANNQGIKKAKGEYLLFLNSDAQTTSHDFVKSLIKFADERKSVGVIGPKIVNSDGSLQPSVGYFPNLLRIFLWMSFLDDLPLLASYLKPYHVERRKFYQKPQKVDWVTGACMFIRKASLDKSGFFDEKIFMYGEEIELCFRIKKNGYQILFLPYPVFLHHKGASGEGKYSGIFEELCFIEHFYKKHYSQIEKSIAKTMLLFGSLARLIIFGIIDGSKRALPYAKYLKMAG